MGNARGTEHIGGQLGRSHLTQLHNNVLKKFIEVASRILYECEKEKEQRKGREREREREMEICVKCTKTSSAIHLQLCRDI